MSPSTHYLYFTIRGAPFFPPYYNYEEVEKVKIVIVRSRGGSGEWFSLKFPKFAVNVYPKRLRHHGITQIQEQPLGYNPKFDLHAHQSVIYMGFTIAAKSLTDLIPNTVQNLPAGYSQSFTWVEGQSDVKSPRLGPFLPSGLGNPWSCGDIKQWFKQMAKKRISLVLQFS